MVYVTVTQVSKDFILVEKPDAQRKSPHTLCKIFNDLEKDGYVLVGAGGSVCISFLVLFVILRRHRLHPAHWLSRTNLSLFSTKKDSLQLMRKRKKMLKKQRKEKTRTRRLKVKTKMTRIKIVEVKNQLQTRRNTRTRNQSKFQINICPGNYFFVSLVVELSSFFRFHNFLTQKPVFFLLMSQTLASFEVEVLEH